MNRPLRADELADPPDGDTPHVIETLQWACRFASTGTAKRHQERLSRFLKEQGARVIHDLFEQLSPPGEVWRIDRLELDLGWLRADASPERWAQQLHECLWNELLRLRTDTSPAPFSADRALPSWPGAADGQALDAERPRLASEHSLDHFLYYVEHGHLPWSAGALAGRDLAGWLEKLARRDGSRLWAQLQHLPLAEQTLQRLSRITPHHGLQALLEARHTGLSAGLTQLDEQVLLPLQARGRLSAYQLQQLQQAWRVAGLRALWGNSSSVLSADRLRQLVQTLTQSLNRMLGPGWRTLLKPATKAGDTRAPSDVAQQLLQGVLGAHTEESPTSRRQSGSSDRSPTTPDHGAAPSASDRVSPTPPLARTTKAALTRLLMLLDGHADESGSTRAATLLQTLSQHCPDQLRGHLQSWALRRARRARWSAQIAPSLLWPLLHCLSHEGTRAALDPDRATQSSRVAAASWAESLRQFALIRLSHAPSASGTLSLGQALLIEYTLRHLALGHALPRDHNGWQALWQSAWKELAGDAAGTPLASSPIEQSPTASTTPAAPFDSDERGSIQQLAIEVKRWLFSRAPEPATPWWLYASGATAARVHTELVVGLRARSMRMTVASAWPEYRRLQLLHLLMVPVAEVSTTTAPAPDTRWTDPATSRWRWVADEVRSCVESFDSRFNVASVSAGAPRVRTAAADTWVSKSELECWLWLATIEWAMQPHKLLPGAAALKEHWERSLLALAPPMAAAEPGGAGGGESLTSAAMAGLPSIESTEPHSRSASSLAHDASAASNDRASVAHGRQESANRHAAPAASAVESLLPSVAASNGAAPASAFEHPHTFGLQELEKQLDAPPAQWNLRLRLQVARLLEDDRTRASWFNSQSPVRHRQLLQRQFPAAFPMLAQSIELLLAISSELTAEPDAGKVERRFWQFLGGYLFGEGGAPEAGPLARRFALHWLRSTRGEGPAPAPPQLSVWLARIGGKLATPSAAASTQPSDEVSVRDAMRTALLPPPTCIETRELQPSSIDRANDRREPRSSTANGDPVEAEELCQQLDLLLARTAVDWRAADRLQLMALLEREEACALWLDHHDETQRWTLLERHLADGAAELRAATEQLVAATLSLQLTASVGEARHECWQFLAQYLFVDGLRAEAGPLARRYAMYLRHRDLDIDAARSVSFQRWVQRLTDALQRNESLPLGASTAAALPQRQAGTAPSTTPAPPPPLLAAMLEALRQPPTGSEQSEASLAIDSRPRRREDRVEDRADRPRRPAGAPSTTPADSLAERPALRQPLARSGTVASLRNPVLPGDERNPIYIANAGLVLLANYSQRLFGLLQLLDGARFIDEAAQWRAIHALEYLVHGHNDSTEPEWVLTKLLCGLPLQQPVPPCEGLDESCRDTLDGLLRAVIAHWKAIGNTSVTGLRESFLQRRGRLVRRIGEEAGYWQLKVEQRPFDLLIDRLPWGFSTIKLPWMPGALHVDWR